ncbi:MAG: 2-dehydropantoate 2-reductase N-terminal domain-containing protein, partial [Acidimicrobiia bacterium]
MSSQPNSIAVIGPGSIGAYVAAQLASSGLSVTACARRPFDTYVVDSPIAPVNCRADVVTDPADVEQHEWVIVAVKTTQTIAASPWLEHLIGPDTTVVAMQNGVEHAERFAPLAHGVEV